MCNAQTLYVHSCVYNGNVAKINFRNRKMWNFKKFFMQKAKILKIDAKVIIVF